jgi:hypothetical protein
MKGEETRAQLKERSICFHSWRHYYTAHIEDRVDMRTVLLATEHNSATMAEHCTDHAQQEHIEAIKSAVGDVFANVIEFKK